MTAREHRIAPAPGAGEEGFVLVSVIWIVGLLAVVATAFVIAVRSQTMAANNAFHNARAESVADGMALATALRLATTDVTKLGIALNGERRYCQWADDVAVAISIQDQGGLVDLNTASPDLVASLLQGLDADATMSATIINGLEDFRDPDHQSRTGGAEPDIFPGKSYGPKNAPLAAADEIDQVPELDDDLFHRLMPYVTVYSQQQGIDPSRAPQALLDLVATGNNAIAAALRFASPSPNKDFGIDIIVQLRNGSLYRRQTVVSLSRQPDRPFAILSWRRGGGTEDILPDPHTLPPCFN